MKNTPIYKYPAKTIKPDVGNQDNHILEQSSTKTVEVIGQWFHVHTACNDCWLYGNPEIFDKDRGILQPTFLWSEPTFNSTIRQIAKPNDDVTVYSEWYQIRCPTTNKTGWVNANSIAGTPITFPFSTKSPDTSTASKPLFPFDPDAPVFSTENATEKPPNQLLSHIRAHGNFIIPKVQFFAKDVRRAIGTLLTNLNHTIWLFALIMVVAASLHFVLANLLVSPQPFFVVFNEADIQSNVQPEANKPSWEQITNAINSSQTFAITNNWLPALLFSAPTIDEIKTSSPQTPLDSQLPAEFLLAALAGVVTAAISTFYLYCFYLLKLSEYSADITGRLRTLDGRLWGFQIVGIVSVIVTVIFLPVPNGLTLYRLWLPTAFMIGSWLTVTLSYPLFFRNRGWRAEWRSLLGIYQGTNTYLFIFTVLFGIVALPYFIKIGKINNLTSMGQENLVGWAIAAFTSLFLSYGGCVSVFRQDVR